MRKVVEFLSVVVVDIILFKALMILIKLDTPEILIWTITAILANVKDIKIRVDFVSKTDKVIDSKEVIIYEFINKGSTKNFKEKITAPPILFLVTEGY